MQMKYSAGRNLLNILILFSCLISLQVYPQVQEKTIISGTVTDANTGDPIPYVSVLLKGTTVGTITNNNGNFNIETTVQVSEIRFSFLGYEAETRDIKRGVAQTVNVRLKLSSITLDEVTVKPGRREYRNKNNPAVELIQKVIDHKSLNRKEAYNFLAYEKYEKIQFAVSNVTDKFKNSELFSRYKFIFDNIDTTKRIGNDVLPVYIKETVSDLYYRKEPEVTKEIIRAEKNLNLEEYLDNKGISANLNYLYQDINIYDNETLFLSNKFLSPIANTAPAFYRYYIRDTISVKDMKCIKLFFEPRNRADFLFHGNLYITMDSSYAVREIDMGINSHMNIDWINDISIKQDFDQFGNNLWLRSKEEISFDAGIAKNALGLYAQRTVSYNKYRINEPIDNRVFDGPEVSERIDPASLNNGFWEVNRQVPLSKSERQIYSIVDSVKKVEAFKRQMNIVILLATSFYNFGKVEIGPVASFYSFNSVEGTRFRFGGRTTPDFSRKITFESYGAYGLKDRIFKYNGGITYSLTPRTIYQFPVKSVKLIYQKDTKIPGQELQANQGDSFFLSFKRGADDKLWLNRTFKLEFLNEFDNHFSYLLGYNYTRQVPEGNLNFTYQGEAGNPEKINSINISEAYLNLRYAPNETFYQGKMYRAPNPSKYPVIQLNITGGSKKINNDFDYLKLQMNISRRYYISIVGYTDVILEAGRIFGTVPYPLLFIHKANQTYTYQKYSYNLMNFLEFVSDKYVSLNVDHSFNGFILNKIPLLRKLKFREIVTCKIVYGGLDKSNNPAYHSDLFRFPADEDNTLLTYTLEKKPYIEAGVGLSNIFRIFRVDLIRRFTYLDHPDISSVGFRVQFRLDI